MLIITVTHRSDRTATQWLRNIHIAVAILSSLLCLDRAPAGRGVDAPNASASGYGSNEDSRMNPGRPMLRVPVTDSTPVVDGKLEEPCWKATAKTGPIKIARGGPARSTTEAFILRDADHLYIGVSCAGKDAGKGTAKPGEPSKEVEYLELLIDSNGDRNSYYLIRIGREGGKKTTSYNERMPPWRDRTWQPRFKSAVAVGEGVWTVEMALPFSVLNKNKTLASEIGFNIMRSGMAGGETHCWQGTSCDPAEGGILTGIPARDRLPAPEYVEPGRWFDIPTKAKQSFLAKQQGRRLRLGPGSTHPGTTGEVRLQLEGFLLAGDPHTRAIIWDLAVNEKKGELYVLSDPKPWRGIPNVRVFDRQGGYLRTIMPFNPALPASSVRDLCRATAVEGGTELVVPRLFEISGGEISLYGAWWHLPQKMTLAPNGDLLLSSIYRGILWRMKPDGSLPADGWTSVHHQGRNEPFDSAFWVYDRWKVPDMESYLPYSPLCYPYSCFDRSGHLYVSGGLAGSSLLKRHGYYWEVGQGRPKSALWKFRLFEGVKIEEARDFRFSGEQELAEARNYLGSTGEKGETGKRPFDGRCGMAIDGDHLIVASLGGCLQAFEPNGRLAASIKDYEHEGTKHPLGRVSALAIDPQRCLYVLAESRKEGEPSTKVIKIESWQAPRLLAVSEPLHKDVLQIAVDGGVSPPLVWVANGAGPGTLLQLAGDDLSRKGKWEDDGEALSSPAQYAGPPILNVDPKSGHIYVEDDSMYRYNRYGTVYRLDQNGTILKKWPPVHFPGTGPKDPPDGFIRAVAADLADHFRYPEEPLFIDCLFGQDGKVYRWKMGKTEIGILRFDRSGNPIPFKPKGTNALIVEQGPWQGRHNCHDVYHGMDVDRQGNLYYVAEASESDESRHQVDVYDADGNPREKGLVQLRATRWIQVDEQGNLYALHKPADAPWRYYLTLSKFAPSGGKALWSRRWDGIVGQAEVIANYRCMCVTARLHQALDSRGYLYAAGKFSIQVIDCETGELVGEFGSYGNMDCRGKGSVYPHPELPFGTISALSVWKDRLFAVDVLNRRIAKSRIVYDPARRKSRLAGANR